MKVEELIKNLQKDEYKDLIVRFRSVKNYGNDNTNNVDYITVNQETKTIILNEEWF